MVLHFRPTFSPAAAGGPGGGVHGNGFHARTTMRRLLFVAFALAIVGLIVTGAIQLQRTDDSITIEINKKRVAEDARKVIKRGKDVLRKAEASIEREVEQQ
jgi:hypothetical protein